MTTRDLPNFNELVQAAHTRCSALQAELEVLESQLPTNLAALDSLRQRLRQAIAESRAGSRALSAPNLHVAFVGTTKAGKSTMVNGFIGRRLAPMESDEMSAGLLELRSGPLSARAERGTLVVPSGPAEESIYEALKTSMGEVVAARRAAEGNGTPTPQPVYSVTAPLFPNLPEHDFYDFTSGRIPVSVFDLPGLRTVNDHENSQVIHEHIGTALNIVVIDRNQLAQRETQAEILEQLKEVVANLGGRTTLMLFLLNKCDTRNTEDQPLEDEVRKVEEMIRARLQLQNAPNAVVVAPVAGLLYYWGARLLVALAEGRNNDAQALRKNLLDDGWKGLSLHFRHEKAELRRLRNALEDDLENGVDSTQELLLDFGTRLLTAAGHDALWSGIMDRVGRECATVLVYPHVSQALRLARASTSHVRAFADAQQVDSEARLLLAEQQLDTLERRVEEKLGETERYYDESTRMLIDAASSGAGGTAKVLHIVNERFGSVGDLRGLASLQPLLSDIKASLRRELLVPVTAALAKKTPSRELLQGFNGRPEALEALRVAYEALKDAGYADYAARGHRHEYRKDTLTESDRQRITQFKQIEHSMADLFLTLRRLMTARAEATLRSQGRHVAADIDQLVRESAVVAWREVLSDVMEQWSAADTFLADRLGQLEVRAVDLDVEQQIALPEEVVRIPEPNFSKEGKTTETYTYFYDKDPKASCFKGRTQATGSRTVDTINIEVYSAATIEERLVAGIDGAIEDFWRHMAAWIASCLRRSLEALRVIFRGHLTAIRAGVAHRREELRTETRESQAFWSLVAASAARAQEQESALAAIAGAGRGS